MRNIMQQLLAKIRESERVVVIAHVNPDGDAVGSVLGLAHVLKEMGKQAIPCLHDPVPQTFTSFLPDWKWISQQLPRLEDIDLCIILDAGEAYRTGFTDAMHALESKDKLAFIDHHLPSELARSLAAQLHDTTACSTAELIYRVASELGIKFTPAISTCLLTGMYTDTGGFQHTNTTPSALEISAELLRRGGKLQAIVRGIEQNRSLNNLRLLGTALERVTTSLDGACVVTALTHEDFEKLSATSEDIPGIIGELNGTSQGRFTMLLTESSAGVIRGSIRIPGDSNFQAHRLARLLGGGGHARAAGVNNIAGRLRRIGKTWKVEEPGKTS